MSVKPKKGHIEDHERHCAGAAPTPVWCRYCKMRVTSTSLSAEKRAAILSVPCAAGTFEETSGRDPPRDVGGARERCELTYCPLSLFSPDQRRFALSALLEEPYNNLKIFHNARLVFTGAKVRHSECGNILLLIVFREATTAARSKILLTWTYTSPRCTVVCRSMREWTELW